MTDSGRNLPVLNAIQTGRHHGDKGFCCFFSFCSVGQGSVSQMERVVTSCGDEDPHTSVFPLFLEWGVGRSYIMLLFSWKEATAKTTVLCQCCEESFMERLRVTEPNTPLMDYVWCGHRDKHFGSCCWVWAAVRVETQIQHKQNRHSGYVVESSPVDTYIKSSQLVLTNETLWAVIFLQSIIRRKQNLFMAQALEGLAMMTPVLYWGTDEGTRSAKILAKFRVWGGGQS